jgi:putative addiction module killer protein
MVDATTPKKVIAYVKTDGSEPFTQWLYKIKDIVVRRRILARISRMQQGNYGDFESVGEGVKELRLFFGSGYRVYFGEQDSNIVILLCGGDKGSQKRDIEQAKSYWKEYLDNEKL